MARKTSLLAFALVLTLVGSAVTAAVVVQEQDGAGNEIQDTSVVRFAHTSADAPAVTVEMDNETVAENLSFGNVTEYESVEPGTYNVTVRISQDANEGPANEVIFQESMSVDAREVTTFVARGEESPGTQAEFEVVGLADDAWTPAADDSALSVAHLSPDAPEVDVTANNGSVVIADNLSYGDVSDYVRVPADDYTLEIRDETEDNNGTVLMTSNASLESEQAYTAWAVGYAAPEEAPENESLRVLTTQDATATIHLPDEEETPTPTVNETETPTMNETETPGVDETETPGVNDTETPGVNDTETPGVNETETPGVNDTETPGVDEETPGLNETDTPEAPTGETPDEGDDEDDGLDEDTPEEPADTEAPEA